MIRVFRNISHGAYTIAMIGPDNDFSTTIYHSYYLNKLVPQAETRIIVEQRTYDANPSLRGIAVNLKQLIKVENPDQISSMIEKIRITSVPISLIPLTDLILTDFLLELARCMSINDTNI